jgi:NAD(P) transhydrogenase subunit alpha
MKIAVPREIVPGERRVALTPDATAALAKSGLEVLVEADAGANAEDVGGYAKALCAEQSRREQELLSERMKDLDLIVTAALAPGRSAPRLVPQETVADMRPGSVIVDLAAESDGNSALTEPEATATRHGVTLHGPTQKSLL